MSENDIIKADRKATAKSVIEREVDIMKEMEKNISCKNEEQGQESKQPRTLADVKQEIFQELTIIGFNIQQIAFVTNLIDDKTQALFKEIFDDVKKEIEFVCRGISLNKEHEINVIFSNMKQRLAI